MRFNLFNLEMNNDTEQLVLFLDILLFIFLNLLCVQRHLLSVLIYVAIYKPDFLRSQISQFFMMRTQNWIFYICCLYIQQQKLVISSNNIKTLLFASPYLNFFFCKIHFWVWQLRSLFVTRPLLNFGRSLIKDRQETL